MTVLLWATACGASGLHLMWHFAVGRGREEDTPDTDALYAAVAEAWDRADALGLSIGSATVEHLTYVITGGLIIFFLIVEPHGLARLWQIAKQKLRVWPFPY